MHNKWTNLHNFQKLDEGFWGLLKQIRVSGLWSSMFSSSGLWRVVDDNKKTTEAIFRQFKMAEILWNALFHICNACIS